MNYLLVFLGGGVGSVMRYLISVYIPHDTKGFPWNTFIANMLACVIIGCVMGASMNVFQKHSHAVLLLTTGLCGGMSTFSTYSIETIKMFQSGHYFMAIIYIMSSLILGLLLSGICYKIVQ
jgi:CrcB protein